MPCFQCIQAPKRCAAPSSAVVLQLERLVGYRIVREQVEAGQLTLRFTRPAARVHRDRLAGSQAIFKLAGALYFLGNLRISPDAAFSINWSAFAIFMVVIGGIGRIEGPIVGSLIFFLLKKLFSDYGTGYLIGLGLLAIVVAIFFKQGLWGWAQARWGWSLFPTRRTLKL